MNNNIHKIITEVINQFIINETAGVNYDILQTAKEMANDFVQNHLWAIYDEYNSREMDWEMDDDDDSYDVGNNPWEDLDETYYFESQQGKSFDVKVFYLNSSKGTLKGQTDGESVEINYLPIKNFIESTFENYHDKFDIKQIEELINREVYEQIAPIFEHELTHTLDKSDEKERKRQRKNDKRNNAFGDTWLSTEPISSIPREDIVYAIYIYSNKEMNARIGSIGAMFQNMLEIYGNDEDYLRNSQYFQELVNEFLETDEYADELKIHDMEMVLSQIANHSDINAKPQIVKNYLKKSNNRPYSFAYYLFRNDSRLNYNRKIKHLFETNFAYGEKAVWNFYKRLYDNYIKRIYKACYASLNNSIQNSNNI